MQRIVSPAARRAFRILLLDNYDSFTFNVVQLLGMLGAECTVVANDAPELGAQSAATTQRDWDGVVISAGPGRPDEAAQALTLLERFKGRTPILGLCLGHQVIAHYFGARVVRAAQPLHGKALAVRHDGKGLFRGLPSSFLAARYNSLTVDPDTVPSPLEVSARSERGEIMGLRHRHFPIEGVQFHPESILSECGPELMGNWLESLCAGHREKRQ